MNKNKKKNSKKYILNNFIEKPTNTIFDRLNSNKPLKYNF